MPCLESQSMLYRFISTFVVSLMVLMGSNLFASEMKRGQKLVHRYCSACHSLKTVTQNMMTRKQWDEVITLMQKDHGLWELSETERSAMLSYLAKVYGVKKKKNAPDLNMRKRPVNPLPK